MPNITLVLTASQYTALTAAKDHHDLTSLPKVVTPEAYLQMVVDGACASYEKQHVVESPEMLKTKLAATVDAKTKAEAEAANEKARADALQAQLDAIPDKP